MTKPDIIMINETWMQKEINLHPSYTILNKIRHDQAGGGVALLCKKEYHITKMQLITNLINRVTQQDETEKLQKISTNLTNHLHNLLFV